MLIQHLHPPLQALLAAVTDDTVDSSLIIKQRTVERGTGLQIFKFPIHSCGRFASREATKENPKWGG
jgi:hypothetical protein